MWEFAKLEKRFTQTSTSRLFDQSWNLAQAPNHLPTIPVQKFQEVQVHFNIDWQTLHQIIPPFIPGLDNRRQVF